MVRGEAAVLSRRDVLRLAAPLAVVAALLLVAPLLPSPHSATQFRLASYPMHAVYFVALLLAVARVTTYWQAPIRRVLLTLLVLFGLVVALNLLDVPVASDVAKVLFGAVAGVAFVRTIERPWWLLPIAVFVPLADAWSVFSSRGVTHAVVDRARENPQWIDWPTIAVPIAGLDYDTFGRIGIVDVLFAALMLGVAQRWDFGMLRGVFALAAGFLATSVLVFEGSDLAIPALPMLCLAFLLAYGRPLWRDLRAAMSERSR